MAKGRFNAKIFFKYVAIFAASNIILGVVCLGAGYLYLSSCSKKGWFSDEHKFLYEKMSEIPVGYEGYYLDGCGSSSDENVFTGKDKNEYTFRNEPLIVNRKNTTINDAPFTYCTIVYKEKEISADAAFMQERSAVYERINHIWDGKLGENTRAKMNEIVSVTVYDEKIFIITCGLSMHLSGTVKGESPYVLYYYDVDADAVYYCGFYSGKLNKYQGYDGFRPNNNLKIANGAQRRG